MGRVIKIEEGDSLNEHEKAFGVRKKLQDPKLQYIGKTISVDYKRDKQTPTYWYVDTRQKKGTLENRKK